MRILVACEYTGVVRDCLLALGHDAMSCDILPTEVPGPHYQGDVLDILGDSWDMMIAHPPCTYLCSSGLHWNNKIEGRAEKTEEALEFVTKLWNADIEKVAIENPVGCISTRLAFMPKPQYIQPYNFGEDLSKKTGWWKRNLPDLEPTEYVAPRLVDKNGKTYNRWANQTDSGQDKSSPSKTRGLDRSRTPFGVAAAIAMQWGK